MMNGGPISWKSRRQDSVALSTSEAEYMAASEAGKEILYLRSILRDVCYAQTASTNIYGDYLGCIVMSTNPVRRKSSRHIDIHVHFCRELYAAGVMKLIPLRTHLMVADPLPRAFPVRFLRNTVQLFSTTLLSSLVFFTSPSMFVTS
jgi:hypothetical protein